MKSKGIYCIEADWSSRPRDSASVAPVLELLSQVENIRSYHRYAINADAARVLLQQWCQKRFGPYPILWLACHGSEGKIHFLDVRRKNGTMTIDQIEEVLSKKRCKGSLIYFGSCSVLKLSSNRWQRFMRNTHSLAVCGYRKDVSWIESAAFELLLLTQIQQNALTRAGAKAMKRKVKQQVKGMARDLGFTMFIRDSGRPGRPRRS